MTGISTAQRTRFYFLIILFTAFLLTIFVLHVGLGSVYISPWDVIRAIMNHPAVEYQRWIVWNLRLPRSLIAPVAGGMLGLAGALMQALTRNPLAEPSLTGVSSGSILGIVLWLIYIPNAEKYPYLLPIAALLGGIGSIIIMYAITNKLKDGPFVLVLKGIVVSAILSSASSLFLIQNNDKLPTVMLWIVGSLDAKVWSDWLTIWPWALVTIPLGLCCCRTANLLQLGDVVSIGLGVRLQRSRLSLFVVAALLTASAVSVVGAISFIGLIGPHIARRLVGHNAYRVFPISILISACLLLLADFVTQIAGLVFGNVASGLPVGAITSLFGAPFFLYLVSRTRR
ncbi:FecCD family ABC transporter permease [Alicyclobacillus fastidiosus]|uniref:Iron ABC transporter permease n=1 Tax=Alicyclobacillus fastidiosus TaxID=392011 RepID=A0ABV5ALI2_9BACL|nr:iron ABC transporter permease [Alicyclobacillus fastidiosus]WEH11064.1 iron ABC transporter permease [Alicyclobacillus fastidiosus]